MIYLPRGAVTIAYSETYVKQVKISENYLYAHLTGVASRAIDDIPLAYKSMKRVLTAFV